MKILIVIFLSREFSRELHPNDFFTEVNWDALFLLVKTFQGLKFESRRTNLPKIRI